MCGIIGCLSFSKEINCLIPLFKNSLKLLVNRGPDNSDLFINDQNKLILGHTRLSIRDLSKNSNQPMFSNNKKYAISYNGEIYNTNYLYNKLKNISSLNINPNSDTEVLFYNFINFGVKETLKEAKGMFAFAFWDNKKNKLYLARDRFGEKPLYYYISKDQIYFSSDLKSLTKITNEKFKINSSSVEFLLKINFIPNPQTIYQNVNKLEPGTILEINNNNFSLVRDKYFDINYNYKKYHNSTFQTSEKNIDKLIFESVKEQLVSDVPVGCFLSSGIDSSIIASNISKINGKFDTFTIGYENYTYDESKDAKKIAHYLHANHNEIILTDYEIGNSIDEILNNYEEPFSDASQIPTSLVSKFASNHVKVILTGDGGDELFGGYSRYIYYNKYNSLFKNIPYSLRYLIALLIQNINILSNNEKFSKISNKLFEIKDLNLFYLYIISNSKIDESLVIDSNNLTKWFLNIEKSLCKNYSEEMQYLDLCYYLTDDVLHKVDRASMMFSLETRAPFLSYDLFKESLKLKFSNKFNKNQGKVLLRNILEKNLPNNLIDYNKKGFGLPLDKFLRTSLFEWAETLINTKYEELNFVNHSFYRDKWEEHKNGKNNQIILWPYFVLLNWYSNSHAK